MEIKRFGLLAACFLVAACGGGGNGAQDRALAFLALAEDPEYQFLTPVSQMPTTGSAQYEGFGIVIAETSRSDDLVAIGTATVDVTFSNGRVTGVVDEFLDPNNRPIGGSVTVDSSSGISGNRFPAVGGGTLTSNGNDTVVKVSGMGEFLGPTAGGIGVFMDGTAETNGYTGVAEVGIIAEN